MAQVPTQSRDQRRRRFWIGATAASYAVDLVFLLLFWSAGTVAALVPAAYAAGAALILGTNFLLVASGWNLRLREPNMVVPFVMAAGALQLGVVLLAPQLAFPQLANLFTVFAFGMIWLPLRASALVWTAGAVLIGAVLFAVGERAAVPSATAVERTLVWLYFSLILGRSLLLSAHANDLRARLSDSRRALEASLEQIQELVHYDELTKAYNRRTLLQRLEHERSRAERTAVGFCVAFLDLDHFKRVNDTHGHGTGDEVLRGFATAVRGAMRESDVFGRYGGEEFLVILAATTPAFARAAVDRILAAVRGYDWGAIVPGLVVTASVGVAGFRSGESVAQLLNRADIALYEAKGAGRNCAVVKD